MARTDVQREAASARETGQTGRPSQEVQSGIRAVGQRVASLAQHKVLLGLILVVLVLASLYAPARNLYVARRTNQDLQAQYEQLDGQNSQLRSDVDTLQSQQGIEDEARRRGYVEPGETPVTVDGLSEDETSGSISGKTTATADTPWYIQVLDVVFQYHRED